MKSTLKSVRILIGRQTGNGMWWMRKYHQP